MLGDGAFRHKIDYVRKFEEILNLEGHPNRITVSRVTAILMNGWILPFHGVALGWVCACKLWSRLVWFQSKKSKNFQLILDVAHKSTSVFPNKQYNQNMFL